jgi:hypothetical protein
VVELKNTNDFFKNKKEIMLEATELSRRGLFVGESSKSVSNEISNNNNNYTTEKTSSYNTGKSNFNKNNIKNNNKNYDNNNPKFSNFNNNNRNRNDRNDRNKKNDDDEFVDLKKPVFTNSKLNQKQPNENEEIENSNKNPDNNNNNLDNKNNQNKQNNNEAYKANQNSTTNNNSEEITNNLANLTVSKSSEQYQIQTQIQTNTMKIESNKNLSINTSTSITIASSGNNEERTQNTLQQQESINKKKDFNIQDILSKQPKQINDDIQNIQNCQKSEIEKSMRNINQINPQTHNPQNVIIPNTANAHFLPMFPNSISNVNDINNLQNIQVNHLSNMQIQIKSIHANHIQGISSISNPQPIIIASGINPVIPNLASNPMNYNLNPQMNPVNINIYGGQHPFYKKFNQQPQRHFATAQQQMNPMQFNSPQQGYDYSGQLNFNVEKSQFNQQMVSSALIQENMNLNANANMNVAIGENNNNIDYGIYAGYYNGATPTNSVGINGGNTVNSNDNSANSSIIDINNTTRKLNVKAKDFVPKKKMVGNFCFIFLMLFFNLFYVL